MFNRYFLLIHSVFSINNTPQYLSIIESSNTVKTVSRTNLFDLFFILTITIIF